MAENLRRPESYPQPLPPASLHFSPNNPSLSVASPPAQHSSFHYPHLYVDHLTAAAASAFYQHQRQQQPQSSVQSPQHHHHPPVTSQPPQPSIPTSASQQSSQSQSVQPAHQSQPLPPYYLQDHATVTAVALQQMQLQMQLQLQAHQQRPSSATQQPSTQDVAPQPSAPPSSYQASSAQMGTAAMAPSISLPLPTQPLPSPVMLHGDPVSSAANHAMGIPSHLSPHVPLVPDSQMASAYRIGRYTPAERRIRLERYREKRSQRNYNRRVKYDCRKMIADKRRRVQGRFVKREEEIALAVQQEKTGARLGERNGRLDEVGNGTDGTEEETKVHNQLESSGSSGHGLEAAALNGRIGDEGGQCVGGEDADAANFSEPSDQVLQQFR